MAASIQRLSKGLKTKGLLYYCGQNRKSYNFSTTRLASDDISKTLKKPNTPVGKWDKSEKHPNMEKEPLEAFPNDVNPITGERGGPKGPEPTRYGDWERKGRCVDF
ncbi:succinate dehydrogenase assembly factor 4, mitochondrial-like [Antedon mediterranea]|uniref:succinate dehydrogenase assembly factor 4, mitochondrial-like n=1 Tax=Antedon mediterranea TaxID=105859 RepID=UPI003AF46E45